ncbi:hypothetical protein Tco_0242675 [Tanacetum coccineum]
MLKTSPLKYCLRGGYLCQAWMEGHVGDEAVHKELGDRMERAATTASSLEAEQDSGSGPRCQDTILGGVDAQTRFETTSKQSNDPPLSRVNTLGSGEDSMKLMELMAHYTKLSELILLETTNDGELKIIASIEDKSRLSLKISTEDTQVETLCVPVTTASATPEVSTAAENLVYIRRSAEKRKDKGKAIMKEDESVQKKIKKQLDKTRNKKFVAEADQLHDIYLSDPEGYKLSHFKGMSYEDIRPIFERVWDQNNAFVPKDSEIEKEVMKKTRFDFPKKNQKSSKKRSREDSDKDNAKKQKLVDDAKKKELRDSIDVVPKDDNLLLIVVHDVLDLHKLVQERYDTTSPEGYDLLLWGDLEDLFEPNEDDEIWKNQQDYKLISWRLFDSCGIHMLLMHTRISIHMMIEKKYPLTQEMLSTIVKYRD